MDYHNYCQLYINAVEKKFRYNFVQQPETHFHPRLQAEVGSILDSIVGFVEKVFIEKIGLLKHIVK